MDPAGIFMLNSIREIFERDLGIQLNSMKFVPETFDHTKIENEVNVIKKCPVIHAQRQNSSGDTENHVMVVTQVKRHLIDGLSVNCIQCKDSYRDNPSESGIFH